MSQNLFQKSLFERTSVCCWPRIVVKIAPNRSCFTFGPPLPARNPSKVASGEGGPNVSKFVQQKHFLSQSRCVAGPELWSKLIQIEASSLLGVSLAPLRGQNSIALASWLNGVVHVQKPWYEAVCGFLSKGHTQVYAQAVLKVGAPGDVSSVGGTPGVWCLNVIGRECWVWVVPCTGSWPGQPPPTKWGKEP